MTAVRHICSLLQAHRSMSGADEGRLSARQVPPVRCRSMVYDAKDASVHVCTHNGRQLEQGLLTAARPHRRLGSNPRRLQ